MKNSWFLSGTLLLTLASVAVAQGAGKGEVRAQALFASSEPVKSTELKQARISRYDENARKIDGPMYDYYAAKIKETTGITRGKCLDVGSGGGYLGLALARITDLNITFLDISAPALEKAKLHIVEDGLQQRATTLQADVQSIPLPDGSMNLVISRGSIPFWKDPAQGIKEIYRVLAPGGWAYVGGGRGSSEIRAQIEAKRKELGLPGPGGMRKEGHPPMPTAAAESGGGQRVQGGPPHGIPHHDYEAVMKSTGITNYRIKQGDDGFWILMWK